MIGTPTPQQPLLVGLLVDVSGSMTSAIQNVSGPSQNRLQSFQSALGDLATKAQEMAGESSEDRVKLFAYGFGFGNPLGAIFRSASSPPVADLLEGATTGSSTIGLSELASNWSRYKSHVEGLAIKMFGATPMLKGVRAVARRIADERQRSKPCGTVLFILSDGLPTDSTPSEVVGAVEALRSKETLVVSCYVTDRDITAPRVLYGEIQSSWPEGARLMFEVASVVPLDSSFSHFLREHGWDLKPDARFFTQVNQSEVLGEFLQVVISPLSENGAKRSSSVFVSYSHADARWRDRLQVHLNPLMRDGTIDLWDDTRIRAGEDWRLQVETALDRANAAVLLVSADFLASDFVRDNELPALLESAESRGLRVLPVIVSPCRYQESPIGRFQAANDPSKPLSALRKEDAEEVLVSLSRDLERAIR